MSTYTVANLGDILVVTLTVTNSSPVVLAYPTTYLSMRQSVPTAVTITLPPNPGAGYALTIKDALGVSFAHNFTVNTSDGSLIDGATTFVLNQDFQSNLFVFDGIGWGVN